MKTPNKGNVTEGRQGPALFFITICHFPLPFVTRHGHVAKCQMSNWSNWNLGILESLKEIRETLYKIQTVQLRSIVTR